MSPLIGDLIQQRTERFLPNCEHGLKEVITPRATGENRSQSPAYLGAGNTFEIDLLLGGETSCADRS